MKQSRVRGRSRAPKSKVPPPRYQLLPALDEQAFRALKADIADRGVLVPIERDEHGVLLDGHHRARAIEELRAEGHFVADPPVIVRAGFSEVEKRGHVRSLNLNRRHLSPAQRRAVIQAQLRDTPGRSDRSIGRQLAVSHVTVGRARAALEKMERSKTTGTSNQLVTRLGDDGKRRQLPQRSPLRSILASNEGEARRVSRTLHLLGPDDDAVLSATDARRAANGVRREQNRADVFRQLAEPGPLARDGGQRFSVIYADPPWQYDDGSTDPTRRVRSQYPTMSLADIVAVPVRDIAAAQAVLFLWTTAPLLQNSMQVIDGWGFSYRSCAVWNKCVAGMGSWGFRIAHEHLLVAVRGAMPTPAPATRVNSVITIKRGAHSAKPPEVRQLIETFYPGLRKVELFARSRAPGWHVWGNQVPSAKVAGRS
jgi:N6-adenosine-specific RNA methylase IME4/ParB-like chromosome segregation protein Spo0J